MSPKPKKSTKPKNTELPEILAAERMSPEKRRERMEELANTARDQVAVAALSKLEDWDRASGTSSGPKPPLTVEERIFRLARLITAVGETEARLAWAAARREWKKEAEYKINYIGGSDASITEETSPTEGDGPPDGESYLE